MTNETREGAAAPAETTQEAVAPEIKVTEAAEATEPAKAGPEAEGDDPATSQEETGGDSSDEGKPRKKGGGFQNRIDKITREKYEAEIRARDAERKLAELTNPESTSLDAEPGSEPKLEQFTTVDDFTRAHAQWAERRGYQKAKQETVQREQEREALSVRATMAAREDAARKKYADYDQSLAPVAAVIMGNPVLKQYAIDSESAPEVAYHLAKNPAKLDEIANLRPLEAIRELLKLEARLTAPPPPKAVTKAPDPIKPVGQSEKAPFSYETASMEEYAKRRQEERRKRKG